MSAIETCADCHAGLIMRAAWDALSPKAREQARSEGFRDKARHQLCRRCAQRRYAANESGETQAGRRDRMRAERLEDIEFMCEHGENLAGAAQRIGMTEPAVEQFLQRADRRDLLTQLRWRNPRDHNAQRDGMDITVAMPSAAYSRKQANQNERRKAQRRQNAAA